MVWCLSKSFSIEYWSCNMLPVEIKYFLMFAKMIIHLPGSFGRVVVYSVIGKRYSTKAQGTIHCKKISKIIIMII